MRIGQGGSLLGRCPFFGSGFELSSIGFTEFLMELEELTDRDMDVDDIDASTRTAGQLYAWLSRYPALAASMP